MKKIDKPLPLQERVIARHVAGQSDREIAREEGLDRETVKRIRTQEEVLEMICRMQSEVRALGPEAILVFKKALASDDLKIALRPAERILEANGALPKGGVELPQPEQDREQMRLLNLGLMADVMLKKNRRYGTPIPKEWAQLHSPQ